MFEGVSDIDLIKQLREEHSAKFAAIIDDDNSTHLEIVMPMYREMVKIFREKMWLAELETRTYFSTLIEFVDIWDRWLRKALPGHVLQKLEHSEEKLHAFYSHIETATDALRTKLSS